MMDGPTQIGEWQKISDLGSGAFGVVTLWRNSASDDYIAIKKCKFLKSSTLTVKQRERWNNEVQIMKIINHPNVIKYKPIPTELEAGLLKHNPTLLPLLPMEYCRKGNLRRVLCKAKNICGLQEEEIRYILDDVGNGLQHLHKLKITHRDIKPDNIVLQHCDDRKGNTLYKIIDLGYAKELNDTVVSFVGTLHYLAPEIFQTEQYNNSVDYWSMGILTFEIICGVLPFLPHLSPFERFERIKEKGPDDICIYLSYSGKFTYSSEIKKENFISNVLKENIEIWLRHVLQFDPNKRSENFPCDINVFGYLNNILRKRIITVFSVHKLEFYSYEINESTLLNTLKDWISRDIKVSKNDLILLFNNNVTHIDESSLVADILKNENNIFVCKKGILFNDFVTYSFTKLIRELFKSVVKFDMKYIKQLYAQTIYFVTTEIHIQEAFKKSFSLFVVYLQHFTESLNKSLMESSKHLTKLLTKIECHNCIRKNNVCDIDLSENKEYKDCLSYCQRLLTSLERSIKNVADLRIKIRVITKRQQVLNKFLPEIEKLIQEWNIQEQYEKTLTLFGKPFDRKQSISKSFTCDIKDVVSEVIKMKDKLLDNKQFNSYLSAMANVHNSAESLNSWMLEFNKHISELSKSFEQSEIVYRDIILKAAENNHKRKEKSVSGETLNGELLKLPTSYLIQENHSLRHKLEEILSKSILAHKNYAESIRTNLS